MAFWLTFEKKNCTIYVFENHVGKIISTAKIADNEKDIAFRIINRIRHYDFCCLNCSMCGVTTSVKHK